MKYPRKFFLNLTSNSISLGIKENQNQYVLDSFDPNEPAASEGLKKLFNLAVSLNSKTPEIEINLPENLLKNETLITDNTISNREAIELINKRKANDKNGIISLTISNIGTRATSISYVQVSLINEVREFVEKAGFSVKKFNIGKFSFENKKIFEFNFQKYFKKFEFLNIKKFTRPIYFSLSFILIGLAVFLYKSEEKVTYQKPIVHANLKIKKLDLNRVNEEIKSKLSNDLFSLNPNLSETYTFKKINTLDTLLKIDKFKSLIIFNDLSDNIKPKNKVYNSKDFLFQNDLDYAKLKTIIFNTDEIINNKNSKLLQKSFVEDIIDYESLFKIFIDEKNHIADKKRYPDFRKIIAYYEPKTKNLNQPLNKDVISEFDEKKKNNKVISNVNEIEEIFPELDPLLIEYAIKILPLKKPLIIDSIRILSEPTLSSGALIFIKNPKERPSLFKNLKIVKPSQIKITAKATRSPSIPKKASVGYNSTKRNFIDLDRTNLIGIIGKSSNPSALLRLSNGKIIKLKVGQWFEGWRVFAIDRDKIHVENGLKQEILRMPG